MLIVTGAFDDTDRGYVYFCITDEDKDVPNSVSRHAVDTCSLMPAFTHVEL